VLALLLVSYPNINVKFVRRGINDVANASLIYATSFTFMVAHHCIASLVDNEIKYQVIFIRSFIIY